MSSVVEDTVLGKIIFTDRAVSKMNNYGLYPFHIIDTLKHGFDVNPLLRGTRQREYLHSQYKQVGVIFRTEEDNGQPIGAVLIISCWAKNIL